MAGRKHVATLKQTKAAVNLHSMCRLEAQRGIPNVHWNGTHSAKMAADMQNTRSIPDTETSHKDAQAVQLHSTFHKLEEAHLFFFFSWSALQIRKGAFASLRTFAPALSSSRGFASLTPLV